MNQENTKIQINIVTVTYGSRTNFLKNLVKSLDYINNQINKIIIIHNDSESDLDQADIFYLNEKVIQLRSSINEGSAVGFKKGLIYSESIGADFTVLVDDDNIFINDSISLLANRLHSTLNNDQTIFAGYRITRKKYLELVEGSKKNIIIKSNRFLGIGISYGDYADFEDNIQFLPYSGLIIPSSAIRKNILPDEDYFLYQDDRDYTFALFKAGYKLKILKEIVLVDQDESWGNDLTVTERLLPSILRSKSSEFKVFHSVKSRILFELRHNVKNHYAYRLNMIIFLIVISIITITFFPISGKFKRLQTILKAIKLGFILHEK